MKNFAFFLILIDFFEIDGQGDFYFTKTLDGEPFETNLNPSLRKNVSYIKAVDINNNKIEYSIKSSEFDVDKNDGSIYLIARLAPNFQRPNYQKIVEISCSNGVRTLAFSNRLLIINSKQPPIITNNLLFLELEEQNNYPVNLTYKNGSLYEINARNPYPLNAIVTLSCDQTSDSRSCGIFEVVKNEAKSSSNEWFGHILLKKKLDYSIDSIYYFTIIASNGGIESTRKTLQIRVLPNLKKAAQLSEKSLFFTIPEEQIANTLIGQLEFNSAYDRTIQQLLVASVVSSYDELLAEGISDQDLNFQFNNKYFYIDQNNRLLSRLKIDSDSKTFNKLNGVVNLWIAIRHRITGNLLNLSKITIQILDLNDNKPKFGIIHQNFSIVSSQIQQVNSSIIENEHGPIILNLPIDRNFLIFDKDLAENSTFRLKLDSYEPKNSLTGCLINKLDEYFNLNQAIESKSTLNLINTIPFDFDTLNIRPSFDSRGVAFKDLNISLIVQELESDKKLISEPLFITLRVQDINDNRPIFNQEVYYIYVSNFTNDKSPQLILKFDVTDQDIGVYGLQGLNCFLLGDGSEKPYGNYEIFEPIYHLILMCKDNKGYGNVAFSNLIINFQKAVKPELIFSVNTYYVLASGPTGTEIPELVLRPKNFKTNTKLKYTVQPKLENLFRVGEDGVFKISAKKLDMSNSVNQNGTFLVPILVNDENDNSQLIHVIVQLSSFLITNQCPKISDNAMCKFSINRESFDPKLIRFCFYGASPVSYNVRLNSDPFFNQILYSLTPDSPQYLYSDSRDGCVKILPSFNLEGFDKNYISYSIGVFNPHYPECVGISKRNCLITIEKSPDNKIRCAKKYQIVGKLNFIQIRKIF
ncbi:cadherin-87A [Brachionus plicatilis]|uniref:Cadherin-87A n=1 Tax=Brachionus plicatilis TaxID=10195 RepID=A0A3M7T3N1_BRAPC|nr:cadherin-87A [Brachionus plicatilis]